VYINYPEAQKLIGELRKGKALKEVRLVDGLFKYKQSVVYMPQNKLRLLAFKENITVSLPALEEKKKFTIEWYQGGTIGRA
jgi:hypothetical protein